MSKEVDQLREERELFVLKNHLHDLTNEDWQVRVRAISGLTQVKKTREFYELSLNKILSATHDSNSIVRDAAIPFLGDLGAGGDIVVARLIELLHSPHGSEVKAAVYSIGKIGSDSLPAISKLIALAATAGEDLLKAIAWSLSMLGPNAVPILINNLKNHNEHIRVAVISALGNMGPLAESAVDHLIFCLDDASTRIKIESAKSIGNLRAISSISRCIAPLKTLLLDNDPDVRWTSAEALRKIGTDEAVAAWSTYQEVGTTKSYFKQLLNTDKSVRLHAAESLYTVLDEESELDEVIIKKALADTYYKVTIALCNSLTKIGEKASLFQDELLLLLDHSEPSVSIAALQVLGKSNCDQKNVVDKIISLLSNQDKEVRLAAGLALEFLDTNDARAALKKFKWE